MEADKPTFTFKQFAVTDRHCAMKVGTDGVVLGAWASCENALKIADIGAGCGIIALMMAQRSGAQIDAVEIDSQACKDMRDNIAASLWPERIAVINSDFDKYTPSDKLDLVVSNPPFFSNGLQSPDAARAAARHEQGLNVMTLIDFAAKHLSDVGRLAMICPPERIDDIIYHAEMSHLKLRRLCRLRQRPDLPIVRHLMEFARIDGPISDHVLTICDADRKHSEEFKTLTRDFYLNF